MNWPIYFRDSLIVGNIKSNLAICTLWSNKNVIAKELDLQKVSVIGNLYTVNGINYIIRNIAANPRIRYIFVTGLDLMRSGEALKLFFEKGVDENYKIIGTAYYLDKFPREILEKIRENVKIVEIDQKSIKEQIGQTFKEADYFMEPVLLKEEINESSSQAITDTIFKIKSDSLIEAWARALDLVLKFGEEKETEYRIKEKEIIGLAVELTNIGDIPAYAPFQKEDLEEYTKHFFSKEKPAGLDYSYGERLKDFDGLNQIEQMVNKLKAHPYSRRAFATTWNVNIDSKSENPPCLVTIQSIVRNNNLYLIAQFRSHDIYNAWPFNVYALRKTQEEIANKLNMQPGILTVISNSAHIYQNNWVEAKATVEKYKPKTIKFIHDPAGYFIISIDKEKKVIKVRHLWNNGLSSGYEFEGKDAISLYKQILNAQLVTQIDHAAYLGRELYRAQIALENNQDYTQDAS
jgi:thymidylate synthase